MIGRDRELELLTEVIQTALGGSGAALLVRGEAGIGKSTLLDWAQEHGAERGMATLRIAGRAAAETAPYAALARMCEPFAAYVDELPAAQASALGIALRGAPGAAPARLAVGVGVVGVLGRAAEERPLLVLIDDAQWLDDESLATILFATRRLADDPIAVVAAARPGVAAALERADLPVVEVSPLAAADATALVTRTGGSMKGETRSRLVAAGAGNPLALLELTRGLRPEQKRGIEPLPELLRGGGAAEAAFARRIAALDAPVRTALAVAAAEPSARGDLIALALAGLALPAAALEAAESAELIVRDGAGVAFVHPLCRAAAYAAAGEEERRAAHAALAAAHAQRGDELAEAGHLGEAAQAPDEPVAERLEHAAVRARRRGAASVAGRAMARAAELSATDADRVRRALAAAGLLLETEHGATVVTLADGVLPLATGPERTELVHALGVAKLQLGEFAAALALLEDEAERVAASDPAGAARLLLSGTPTHVATGQFAEEGRLAERAAELARPVDPALARTGDMMAAHAHLLMGDAARAAALIDPYTDALGELPFEPPFELATFPANVLILLERFEQAELVLDAPLRTARAQALVAPLVYMLLVRAQLRLRTGRVRAAESDAREAARLAADANQAGMLVLALGELARAEALGGAADDCRRHALRAIELGAGIGSALPIYAYAGLGWLELALGRPAEAVEPLLWCERYGETTALDHAAISQTAADLVEALCALDRHDEARAVAARLAERAERTGDRWSRAAAQRAAALPLTDHDAALEQLTAAAAIAADVAPLETARVQLDRARRLRAAGRRSEASAAFDAAAQGFARAGAVRWEQRARAEQAPGSARRKPTEPPRLTALEERIAELAAEGMSNPEIGAELFFSRKTIERRMSAILAKLGLRSRAELPAALARLGRDG